MRQKEPPLDREGEGPSVRCEQGPRQGPLTGAGIALLVLGGTLTRLVFGLRAANWLGSPDHLAWTALLDEGRSAGWRMDQLVHYPHEGSSFVLSLLSLLLPAVVLGVPALSWVALGVDAVSRAVQILSVRRLFEDRSAAWFGLWTAVGTPLIVNFGMANLGGHSLSAAWPMGLLALACRSDLRRRDWALLGALAGVALSWSFSNVAVLPALLLAVCWQPRGAPVRVWQAAGLASATGLLVLGAIQAFLRIQDLGFALETEGTQLWLRGVAFTAPDPALWFGRLRATLTSSLLSAAALHRDPEVSVWFRGLLAPCLATGWFLALRRGERRREAALVALSFVTFATAYAFSPFASVEAGHPGYVTYRHWSFALPTLFAGAFFGATRSRITTCVALAMVSLSGAATFEAWRIARPPSRIAWRECGWVIGRKVGDDPARVQALIRATKGADRRELTVGVGWGTAMAVAGRSGDRDDSAELAGLIRGYDDSLRPDLMNGVRYACSEESTPRLDRALAEKVGETLGRMPGGSLKASSPSAPGVRAR